MNFVCLHADATEQAPFGPGAAVWVIYIHIYIHIHTYIDIYMHIYTHTCM